MLNSNSPGYSATRRITPASSYRGEDDDAMPYMTYEIRVTKITIPLIGNQTHELLYLAKPTSAPDPGACIAAFNPTLTLPLPPSIKLEAQATVEALAEAAVEAAARR
jgi:hypothetical protein